MKIFTVINKNHEELTNILRNTFSSYHDLVICFRKSALDSNNSSVFMSSLGCWNEFENPVNITEQVMTDAYNNYVHWKDENFIDSYNSKALEVKTIELTDDQLKRISDGLKYGKDAVHVNSH